MDDLFESALDAAALRPDNQACENHPERAGFLAVNLPSIRVRRYMCADCRDELANSFSRSSTRAFATGLGSEAAQESREAQAYQEEYDRLAPIKQSWRVRNVK